MDPVKCGRYLRTLRKEKGLTQEQLAEKLSVTNRSVSRWETGANLPDIDILITLSEFYDADIRELLDGENKVDAGDNTERDAEIMQAEEKEVLIKAAEYGAAKENGLARAVFFTVIAGIAAIAVTVFTASKLLNNALGSGIILFASVLAFSIYCICMQSPRMHRSSFGYLVTLISAFISVVTCNALVLLLFFASGEYRNYGIAGLYYALGIIILVFVLAGIIARIIIKKRA
ncbi:MAG: helix-turn-helix domain-containing protein [Clostridia bacterium]|nr:helix-turn-helix domain-containing protein [Clostridia bacterium]